MTAGVAAIISLISGSAVSPTPHSAAMALKCLRWMFFTSRLDRPWLSLVHAEWLQLCHYYGSLCAMRATIDSAGRIVVPKALRLALGLKAGQPLEIRAGDGRLEIEIAATPVQLKKRGKGVVAVPGAELPVLTAEQVRDTLERIRR